MVFNKQKGCRKTFVLQQPLLFYYVNTTAIPVKIAKAYHHNNSNLALR
jgi:hypothetical protein